MQIQIRTGDLTPEQITKEILYEAVVERLNREGVEAEYRMTVCSYPDDEPGYITLK